MTYPLGPGEAQLPTAPPKADEDLLRAPCGDANLGPWTGKADGLLADNDMYSIFPTFTSTDALLVSIKQLDWVSPRAPPVDSISKERSDISFPVSTLVLHVETNPCV